LDKECCFIFESLVMGYCYLRLYYVCLGFKGLFETLSDVLLNASRKPFYEKIGQEY